MRLLEVVYPDEPKSSRTGQHELARRLKRSQSFIAKLEVGGRRLDVVELIEIARALGKEPTEMLSRVLE